MSKVCLILYLIICSISCKAQEQIFEKESMNGITMVAPSSPINDSAFIRLAMTNANWVALIPYGFQNDTASTVHSDANNRWWGESDAGIRSCVSMARKQGLKVLLKPQVWIRGSWVGSVDYNTEEQWQNWESSYRKYMDIFIKVAVEEKIELFCIGTEFDIAAQKRPLFWKKLISDIRKDFKGKLVYSSNWDNYQKIPFWKELDYIGISGYYPLNDMALPSVALLENKWKKQKNQFKKFSNKMGKQILFTEYGYLSTDYCASKTWELEAKMKDLNVNEQCQANALEALYKSLWNEPYFAGGFLWKWFPSMPQDPNRRKGSLERRAKEYDPQNKLAESIIKKYYTQN
jgi:hypothetical protein